uniref:Uncharacterized protein n=1 Tax=Ananas comosus var. bracteatus TaxID=296719 RepID=A0A6V7QN03_ANACO|nr:unnamed protein product [Ananas comosus var. bracteatus]
MPGGSGQAAVRFSRCPPLRLPVRAGVDVTLPTDTWPGSRWAPHTTWRPLAWSPNKIVWDDAHQIFVSHFANDVRSTNGAEEPHQQILRIHLRIPTNGILFLHPVVPVLFDNSLRKSPGDCADFEEYQGIKLISELMQDDQKDDTIRLKCAKFLLLLTEHACEKEESVHEDIRDWLGENCASLMWTAGQFGSTLDPEQRSTAVRNQAWRILESLEL